MQTLLPAAVMVGLARSISLVLADGHVIDTILNGLAAPLGRRAGGRGGVADDAAPGDCPRRGAERQRSRGADDAAARAAVGPARLSRQVPVLAYQTGAGLTELVTPTNGALMAILLAAGVPFERWMRFAVARR